MIFPSLFGSKKPNGDEPKYPGTTPYLANNSRDLGTQILLSLAFGTLGIYFFCVLRRKWPNIYSPRSRLKRGAPTAIPNTFWGWIPVVWNTSEKDILFSVGLDAVVYMRFFKLMISLFSVVSFFGIFIIVPLEARYNYINAPKKDPSNALNSSRPKDPSLENPHKSFFSFLASAALGSNQVLIAHLIFGYFFVCLVYLMVTRFAYNILSLRWSFLHRLQKSVPVRTIMLQDIPENIASAESLKNYFEDIGVGQVESSCIIPKFTELDNLIKMRASVLLKIERRYASLLGNPCTSDTYDPKVLFELFYDFSNSSFNKELKFLYEWASCSSFKGPKFKKKVTSWLKETIKLRTKFKSLDYLVRKERHQILNDSFYPSSNVGFVTFTDAKSAMIAAQLNLYSEPRKFIASLAPEPRDICWNNLTISSKSRNIRNFIVRLITLLMFVFWLVPITALSALLSPEFLDGYFPGFSNFVKKTPILDTFLRFTVPSLILFAYNEIYPYFLNFLNMISGQRRISKLQIETIQQYFFYLVVSVLLIFTLSSAILDKLKEWIENPAEIPKSLANTLPNAAPFFMGYITLLGLGYYPLRLMRFGTVFLNEFSRFFCKSPRDYADCYGPEYTNWTLLYPQFLLVFAIASTYSSIAPLINVFAMIYFVVGYVVNKYLILYVYSPPYETAGLHVVNFSKDMITSLFIYLLLMLGIFALKGKFILFLFQFFLILINLYLRSSASTLLESHLSFIPLDMLTFGPHSNASKRKPSNHQGVTEPPTVLTSNWKSPLIFTTPNKPYGSITSTNGTEGVQFSDYSQENNSQNISNISDPSPGPSNQATHVLSDNEYSSGNKKPAGHIHRYVSFGAEGPLVLTPTVCDSSTQDDGLFNRSLNFSGDWNQNENSNGEILEESYSPNSFKGRMRHMYHSIRCFSGSFFNINKLREFKKNLLGNNLVDGDMLSSRDLFNGADSPDTDLISKSNLGKQPLNHGNNPKVHEFEYNFGNRKHNIIYSSNLVYSRYSQSPQSHSADNSGLGSSSHLINESGLPSEENLVSKDPTTFGLPPTPGFDDTYEILSMHMPQSTELRWYGNTSESAIEPNSKSDYSQTGMNNCFGVLDSNNQPYMYPQLVGMLPYLWLPSKPKSS
ncbi:Calcium permeable stress-gated cation channel 1 [Smittium mucronatum]|uniref:Calcium permeable stress-gated cation channel 1 n=1 Tax=Smittium mucronatum TaxID=133383 RepID=A0A1R0H2P1_9FUNG|nr:Calcium permeable stress-gated cation channel 1 [Smittium mucronatum]